jgi:hypothetical protein
MWLCFISGKLEDFWGYDLVSVGVLSLYIGSFSNEYEIRQVKRMVYAYAIPYWREKVVAVAHLITKLWGNLVVLTMTLQKTKKSFYCFQK